MYFVFIVFALLIIAHFIGQYAQNKGRSYWGFVGLSLLCLPIGLIAAVLATPNQEIVALSSNQVKCRFCAEYIKKEAKICKYCQREQALSESEKIEGEVKLVTESLPEEQLMLKHGITYIAGKYCYGSYRYDKLSDAIAYSKLQESKKF